MNDCPPFLVWVISSGHSGALFALFFPPEDIPVGGKRHRMHENVHWRLLCVLCSSMLYHNVEWQGIFCLSLRLTCQIIQRELQFWTLIYILINSPKTGFGSSILDLKIKMFIHANGLPFLTGLKIQILFRKNISPRPFHPIFFNLWITSKINFRVILKLKLFQSLQLLFRPDWLNQENWFFQVFLTDY